MRLYLDDDTASAVLTNLLRKAGHEVQLPSDVGMSGAADAVHLTRAIHDNRVCVTKNHDDFWILHNLIMQAQQFRLTRTSPFPEASRRPPG